MENVLRLYKLLHYRHTKLITAVKKLNSAAARCYYFQNFLRLSYEQNDNTSTLTKESTPKALWLYYLFLDRAILRSSLEVLRIPQLNLAQNFKTSKNYNKILLERPGLVVLKKLTNVECLLFLIRISRNVVHLIINCYHK